MSKHLIQPLSAENERADAGRDGRTCLARPISQARTRRGGKLIFPVELTTSRIGSQPYPVDPYSAINRIDDHEAWFWSMSTGGPFGRV